MISLRDGGQEGKRGLPVMPFYIVVTFNSVSILPMGVGGGGMGQDSQDWEMVSRGE